MKVGAFHDENANDHLDTNVLGLPTEGYALSNGVRPVRRNRIVPHLYAAFTPEYRNPSRSFMCAYVALRHRRALPRPGGAPLQQGDRRAWPSVRPHRARLLRRGLPLSFRLRPAV